MMANKKTQRRKEEPRNVTRVKQGKTPRSTNPATRGQKTTKKR